jgi:hypothetical protein
MRCRLYNKFGLHIINYAKINKLFLKSAETIYLCARFFY